MSRSSDSAGTPTTTPRTGRFVTGFTLSALLHLLFALLVYFDVAGIGGGFGIGVGPGIGIGSGGDIGLGKKKARQIYSLEDIPEPVKPRQVDDDELVKKLLEPEKPQAVTVPRTVVKPVAPSASPTAPVVHFARPVKPLGDVGAAASKFAAVGKGTGGLMDGGGGGGGFGISLGSLGEAFGKYVGTLRKGGLDVAIVVDATGSMQNIIDTLKRKLDDMVVNMQRLVPTARIGAVAYRDRDSGNVATAPRQSEDFVVKWSDLTFNSKKVQSFLNGIVAEGGGDWEEAVKDGVDAAIANLKWREDAKKVIIIVGSSPPHKNDVPALMSTIASWHAKGGVVSTIDVSQLLHEEHERRINKWLYGEEPKAISPLPEFYGELKASFDAIARGGGGDDIALTSDSALARHILVLAFGPEWQKDIGKVSHGL